MRRREFTAVLAGAAAWPLAGQAQQPERLRHVGVLLPSPENDPTTQAIVTAFGQALGRFGWIEGKNIRIDYRFAAGDPTLYKIYAAGRTCTHRRHLTSTASSRAPIQPTSPLAADEILAGHQLKTEGARPHCSAGCPRPRRRITGQASVRVMDTRLWAFQLDQERFEPNAGRPFWPDTGRRELPSRLVSPTPLSARAQSGGTLSSMYDE